MSITRRIFAKTMVAAPVAAASLGSAPVGALAGSSSIRPLQGALAGSAGLRSSGGAGFSLPPNSADFAGAIKDYAERLVSLGSNKQAMIEKHRRALTRLDADLAASRSMSMATKIRIQAERDVDAEIASEKSWLLKQIKSLMEQSKA